MKQIILVCAILFVTLTLLMYLFQRHLIYFPSHEIPDLNTYQAHDMQVITLHTQDGLVLHSWYKPAKTGQPTVLYVHGNAGHIGNRMKLGRQLMDAGLGLLLLEYRGYGGNKGQPSEQGLYDDGRAGLRFLYQHGVKLEHLALYGESLGTGVATALASENKVCALVLQSPYTSLADLAQYHYPWLWLKPWDRFDSIGRIQSIHAPLLIIHGQKDVIVPYSQGQQLYQQANNPKKMLHFLLATHNNLWDESDFSKNIVDFIDHYCTVK